MAFKRSSSLFSIPLPTSTGTGLFCSAWTVEGGGSAVRALVCDETSQGRAGCENCSCSTSKAASVKSWQIGITNDMPEKITHNWQSVFVMGCNLLHGFLGLKLIGWPRRRAAVEISDQPIGGRLSADSLNVDYRELGAAHILRDIDVVAVPDVHTEGKERNMRVGSRWLDVFVSAGEEEQDAADRWIRGTATANVTRGIGCDVGRKTAGVSSGSWCVECWH